MTWLLLWVLWLATTGLTYSMQSPVEPMVEVLEQQQQLIQDELERNFYAEQEEIIIEDYFLFLDKIGKIKYARWCMGEYTPATRSEEKQKRVKCSDNAFDCAGLVKGYGVAKGILSTKEVWHMNSQTIVLLWQHKDASLAQRGDFTSRQGYGDRSTGNLSTHFAMISRDYTGGSILWIYDNVNGPNNNIVWERSIRVAYVGGKFHYMGKYRINVYTNGLVEAARERGITVEKRYDTDPKEETKQINPLGYSTIITWYDYDSDANKIASYRTDNWWTDYMIAKFIAEAHFDIYARGKAGEQGICQLMPNRTNNVWLKDPRREQWWEFQAKICLEKWNAVPEKNRDTIRQANAYTELWNIFHLNK